MNHSIIIRLKDWMSVDTRSLAVARITLGLTIFLDMLLRLTSVEWHYTDIGLTPRQLALQGLRPGGFSFFFFNGSEEFATLLLILQAFAALFLTIGWKTRFFTILNTIFLMSLHNRNPYLQNGGDMVARTIMMIAIFLPWGEMWSLDQWKKNKFRSIPRTVSGSWILSLYVLGFAIYFVSFLFKLRSSLWFPDLSALSYVMNIYAFSNPMGKLISSYEGLLKIVTVFTLVLESAGPFLLLFGFFFPRSLWRNLKLILIVTFVFFHLGISIFIFIGLFPYYCIALWLAFLPTSFWNWILKTSPPEQVMEGNDKGLSSLYWGQESLGIFVTLTMLFFSISIYRPFGLKLPSWELIARTVYLDQNWTMFSSPPQRLLWWEIPAKLENGDELELITGEKVEGSKEVSFVNSIPDSHWRKFYGLIINKKYLRQNYAEALCRMWNRPVSEGGKVPRLSSLAIRLHGRPYDSKYRPGKESFEVILKQQCQ